MLYCTITAPINLGRGVEGVCPVEEADIAGEDGALCVPLPGLHPEPAGDLVFVVHTQGGVVTGHALNDQLAVHSPGHADVVRVEA